MTGLFGGFEIFGFALIALVVWALWSTVKIVPQGFNYTVENLGRYTKTLNPGLHILIPVIEHVGHQINMKEQVMDIPTRMSSPATTQWCASMASHSTKYSVPQKLRTKSISSITPSST